MTLQTHPGKPLRLILQPALVASWLIMFGFAQAQTLTQELANPPATAKSVWTVTAAAQAEQIGVGFPVGEVNQEGWSAYLQTPQKKAHGRASVSAELLATSPQGWRFGVLNRSEAWINASAGTVEYAALQDRKLDPKNPTQYAVAVQGQSWSGQGLQGGTPWFVVPRSELWQWRASGQLLKLQQLRSYDMQGTIAYQGAGQYDIYAAYSRSNANITSAYLAPSEPIGWGSSLSFDLSGKLSPTVNVDVSAKDLISKLTWANLATDSGKINTQNVTRAADGTLDYAPKISGKKSLENINAVMGTHWQVLVRWTPVGFTTLTMRIDQKAENSFHWLGLQGDQWRIEYSPMLHATKLAFNGKQLKLSLGTDGQRSGTGYLSIQAAYTLSF